MGSRTSTAKLNFLSSSWLTHSCGLQGVVKAVKVYKDAVTNAIEPHTAYKSTSWLTDLEPDSS